MIAVYNILCMLLCMVPTLSFLAASVAMALYGHPYFAAVFAMFAVFTTPKLSLRTENKGKKDETEISK